MSRKLPKEPTLEFLLTQVTNDHKPKTANSSQSSKRIILSRKGSNGGIKKPFQDEFVEDKPTDRHDFIVDKNIHWESHGPNPINCKCDMCKANLESMKTVREDEEFPFFAGLEEISHPKPYRESDFNFILSKIQPPKHFQRTLRLNIPDTCLYQNGEPVLIITSVDKQLKFNRQREKLMNNELRKFFQKKQSREHPLDPQSQKQAEELAAANQKNMDGITFKEVVLIKYNDESTGLISDYELAQLFLKRRIDPIWKEISYIQNYAKLAKYIKNFIKVYFHIEKAVTDPLFKRAENEILYLNGDIPTGTSDYIPLNEEEAFEEELRLHDESKLALFLMYRIYHFFKITAELEIKKMVGDFIKDERGHLWLINILHLDFKKREVPKIKMLNFHEEVNINSPKLQNEMEGENPYFNVERNKAVELMNKILQEFYQYIKTNFKIILDEDYYKPDMTNEEFLKIHPEVKFDLDLISQGMIRYDEIKNFVLDHLPQLYDLKRPAQAQLAKKTLKKAQEFNRIKKPQPQAESKIFTSRYTAFVPPERMSTASHLLSPKISPIPSEFKLSLPTSPREVPRSAGRMVESARFNLKTMAKFKRILNVDTSSQTIASTVNFLSPSYKSDPKTKDFVEKSAITVRNMTYDGRKQSLIENRMKKIPFTSHWYTMIAFQERTENELIKARDLSLNVRRRLGKKIQEYNYIEYMKPPKKSTLPHFLS